MSKTITFCYWDIEYTDLPAKWEICGNCGGDGKHVNPAIDGHGISPEEFAEDPDFEEAYFSGVYDVLCQECKGSGKVLGPDFDKWDNETIEAYHKHLEEEASYRAMCEAERRMGA